MRLKPIHLLLLLIPAWGIFSIFGPDFWKASFSSPLLPPGVGHFLGTNSSGQDVFRELVFGANTTLLTAFSAVLLSMFIGSATGGTAGYFRGPVDFCLTRLIDLFLVIPGLPLMVILAAVMQQGSLSVVLAIAISGWAPTARIVRSHVLQLREEGFILAARSLGAGHFHIIFQHLLPNSSGIILAKASLSMAGAMLAEAGLSFLGLGDPVRKSWGAMLNQAFSEGAITNGAWWCFVPPMFCLCIFVLLFMVLGNLYINNPKGLFSTNSNKKSPIKPRDIQKTQSAIKSEHFSLFLESAPNPQMPLLENMNFNIEKHEKIGICGHTASGKSLLILSLLGLLPLQARVTGRLEILGLDILKSDFKQNRKLRANNISYVPQASSALNPVLKTGFQIMERAGLQERANPENIKENALGLLKKMGFDEPEKIMNTYPHRLSGGMLQRALFAMALCGNSDILLADEPTKNLDLDSQMAVIDIINSIKEKTVITVTHDLNLAGKTTSRMFVFGQGLILEDSPTNMFFDNPLHPFSKLLIESMPENNFMANSKAGGSSFSQKTSGCPFFNICPDKKNICRKMPDLKTVKNSRVRCWKYVD